MFRFGYTFANLRNEDGEMTGAMYGIIGMLQQLKAEYPDGKFIFVWDGSGPTWRSKVWAGYKQNRTTPTEESIRLRKAVNAQIPRVKKLVKYLGIPQLQIDGVEADDLIGLLCGLALKSKIGTIIYSSDKDFMQLMALGVSLIRGPGVKPESAKTVFAKFGCALADVLKLRVLCGDPSDGISPVRRGIGPKTALKYLAAGVDPTREKPTEADALVSADWANVRVNYRLMRILTAVDDPELPKALRTEVAAETDRVFRAVVFGEVTRRWKRLMATLGEYGMHQAVQNRKVLYHIQSEPLSVGKIRS